MNDLRERVMLAIGGFIPGIYLDNICMRLEPLIRSERAVARETLDGDWQALAVGENEYIYGYASVIAKVQAMLQRLAVAESMIYRARAEEERRGNS